MPYAEFEEKEYEGPLNNELLGRSSNLWTPGLVFEYYFGIDAGICVQNQSFWRMMGFDTVPIGVSLPRFNWSYLWRTFGGVRRLPAFNLNLFLQTKRPFVVRRPQGKFASLGYTTPFWRFKITGHQQRALQRLAGKVGNAGLVSYGCAAFDTLDDLYDFIPNRLVLQNSTFIEATFLRNHKYWTYDQPGSTGTACSEPERIEGKSILDRIETIVNAAENSEANFESALRQLPHLAKQMLETCLDEIEEFEEFVGGRDRAMDDSGNARARFFAENAVSSTQLPDNDLAVAFAAFHDINFFCHLFNLRWHVIG